MPQAMLGGSHCSALIIDDDRATGWQNYNING